MKAVAVIIIVGLIIGVCALVGGFVWMVCLGALSHIFNQPNLAIGYWPSVLVALIFGLLFGGVSRAGNDK